MYMTCNEDSPDQVEMKVIPTPRATMLIQNVTHFNTPPHYNPFLPILAAHAPGMEQAV
jgi:hypothetical protein